MPDQTDTPLHVASANENSAPSSSDLEVTTPPSLSSPPAETLDKSERTFGLDPTLLVEIEKWRAKDYEFRKARYDRNRAPAREADRKAYAERIMLEQGREVRAYLPSSPERRKLQKAASRARRKAAMTPELIEARRRQDRERKAFHRELQREYDNTELLAQLDEFLAELPED